MKNDNYDKGFTLVELIIVIAIMAVLVGVVVGAYTRYIVKTKKALDRDAAEKIGLGYTMAMIEYPEVESLLEQFIKEHHCETTVSATVNGVTESYRVVCVVASEKTYFTGGDGHYVGTGFYELLNELSGLRMVDGANYGMMPRYKIKRSGNHPLGGGRKYGVVDRWRICCRVSDRRIEVWSACESGWGGYPEYRVWPDCDDIYK